MNPVLKEYLMHAQHSQLPKQIYNIFKFNEEVGISADKFKNMVEDFTKARHQSRRQFSADLRKSGDQNYLSKFTCGAKRVSYEILYTLAYLDHNLFEHAFRKQYPDVNIDDD